MRNVLTLGIFLGVSGTAVSALGLEIRGSQALSRMTEEVLSRCSAGGITYSAGSPFRAERALLDNRQKIAPMARFLSKDLTCQHATPQEAEGRVVALQSLVLVANSGSSTACGNRLAFSRSFTVAEANGIPGLQCAGCVGSTYVFQDWRDVLRILYTGMSKEDDAIGDRDCSSDLRRAIANNWSSLFEDGCTSSACSELRHAFRPGDFSASAELLLSLLGLPDVDVASEATPFCNVRQPFDSWSPAGDATNLAPSVPPYFPEFQDNDPIRRTCAGTGNLPLPQVGSEPPNEPTEQVCSAKGNLGLVLTIEPPKLRLTETPDPYPLVPCARGSFVFGAASRVSAVPARYALCPNGDLPKGSTWNPVTQTADGGTGVCLIPTTSSGDPRCLNGKNNVPVKLDPPVTSVDGRVYNLHLRRANGAYQTMSRQRGAGIIEAQITGAFYRLHSTRTLVAPANTNGCTSVGSASQVGCLSRANPCSIGAADLSASEASDVTALSVNGIAPTLENIRRHIAEPADPHSFLLASRLFLNSMVGFDVVPLGSEDSLADCFNQRAITDAAASAAGLLPLNVDPICVDFDERQCGGFALNTNACKKGFNICPVINAFSAAPLQTSVGGQISLSVSASDQNADPLVYLWTATAGSFTNSSAASTLYTCSIAGPQTIAVTVWDGKCEKKKEVGVTCVAP